MALDGEKVRQLRLAKGISQERLALLCNVNKRTVQRAETGAPVALETAAFIAEALSVPALSLRAQIQTNSEQGAAGEVILVPVNSGRRIVDAIRLSFETNLTFEVEPTRDNVNLLGKIAELLEPMVPNIWADPHDEYNPTYAEVIQKQADVNEILPMLAAIGINVFLGAYTASRRHPRYDMDEGHKYVTNRTPFEPAEIVLVVISDTTASHLVRRPADIVDDIPF
ncbi:helix-turn-helix transcriptional regulator (plasmid) [Rhizobium sp. CB3171]|uniref:helix-turn-helix domain-containing protein n=1 Tax=Rhizobium sp. CB3171 TaxID=3039157 RepID=UPI0024B1942A|nr:helix-turn-helix transcriptional regulator [Rhizobium sp. CB3171]WFU07530.1 helix-turn-helix transcriptional regulator [Rhizobium sp. CB3171]